MLDITLQMLDITQYKPIKMLVLQVLITLKIPIKMSHLRRVYGFELINCMQLKQSSKAIEVFMNLYLSLLEWVLSSLLDCFIGPSLKHFSLRVHFKYLMTCRFNLCMSIMFTVIGEFVVLMQSCLQDIRCGTICETFKCWI